MKKNKLLVAVTKTTIYEYDTDTEDESVALDEFTNQSGKRFKIYSQEKATEIHDFYENEKPIRRKK
ncbi:MAG: hypothetical protein KA146_02190 [Leptospiraceae bacterium]|nr:hypothetical protein [Leptospiraceae bacterium]